MKEGIKSQKPTREQELEKGCGCKLRQYPFVERAEKCGDKLGEHTYFCDKCVAEFKGFKQGQLSERKKNIKKIKKFEFNYYDCEIGTGFDDWVKREKERIIEQIQGGKE